MDEDRGRLSQPRKVAAAKRAEEGRERRFLNAVRAVIGSTEGRLMFGDPEWGILPAAGLDTTCYSDDPYRMAYLCGLRDAGLRLKAMLVKASLADYQRMEKEIAVLRRSDLEGLEAEQQGGTTTDQEE